MRKLACFAGSFSLGIFLAQYLLPASWLLPGAAVCFAIACGALLLPERWRRRMLLAGVGLALALGWNWLYVREVQSPMEALAGQERQVTMTLCAYPSATDYGAKATVRIEGIPFGKAVYYGDTSLLELRPGQAVMDTVLLRSAEPSGMTTLPPLLLRGFSSWRLPGERRRPKQAVSDHPAGGRRNWAGPCSFGSPDSLPEIPLRFSPPF